MLARVSEEIMRRAELHGVAAFDPLLCYGRAIRDQFRGSPDGLMAGDRVHYSRDGYERQGRLITSALERALSIR